MTKHYQLGIDGGGSGSRFSLLCEDSQTISTFNGPPLQLSQKSEDEIFSAICKALDNHFHEELFSLTHINMGIAGANSLKSTKKLRGEFRQLYNCDTTLLSDAEAAFYTAFGLENPGMLLINGTGSVILISEAEQLKVFGGYGPDSNEILSGRSLGKLALLFASHLIEARKTLPDELFKAMPVRNRRELTRFIKQNKHNLPALAAPLLIEAESNSDIQCILELEFNAFRMWLNSIKQAVKIPIQIALHGGLYNNAWFSEKVTGILKEAHPEINHISKTTGVSKFLAKAAPGTFFRQIRL